MGIKARTTRKTRKLFLAEMPDNLVLIQSSAIVTVTPDSDTTKPEKLAFIAYTGGKMKLDGVPHPVIFDVSSLTASADFPLLYQHSPMDVLGHSEKATIQLPSTVLASGFLSGTGSRATEIRGNMKNGVKYQSSLGVQPGKIDFYKQGETVAVNGQTFTGPVLVARNGVIRELSVVPMGADGNTVATLVKASFIAAYSKGDMMNFSEWCKANNIDISSLSAAQVDILKSAFTAWEKANGDAPAQQMQITLATNLCAGWRTTNVPANNPNDIQTLIANAINQFRTSFTAEQTRVDSINRLSTQYGQPKNDKGIMIASLAINENWTVEAAEVQMLKAARPNFNQGGGNNNIPDNVLEAALAQAGKLPNLEKYWKPEILEAAHTRFHSRMGLQEFLYVAATMNGYDGSPNVKANLRGIMRAAFSTMSIPGILARNVTKYLVEGYRSIDESWRLITKIRNLSDFKETAGFRPISAFTFEDLAPDGQIPHGKMDEAEYGNKLKTTGKMFATTRQDLINDDMGAISEVPRMLGRGGKLKFLKDYWTEFLDNSGNFWHADNTNVSTGVFGIAGLSAANTVFKAQRDEAGDLILASPKYVVVPPALYPSARTIYTGATVDGQTASATGTVNVNPWVGSFIPVEAPYLADTTITGNSSVKSYMLADPNDIPTIEAAFLNGQEEPIVESADADFDRLGVQWRGYHDAGVRKQNPKGSVQSSGA